MNGPWRPIWRCLVLLLGLTLATAATAQPFALARLAPGLDPAPAQVLAGAADIHFDPVPGVAVAGPERRWQWWRLVAQRDIDGEELPQLVLTKPRGKNVQLWRLGATEPVHRSLHGRSADFRHSSRYLVFPLEAGLRRGEAIYLRMHASDTTPSVVSVQPLDQVHREDMAHVAVRGVVLTALGVIALLAFGFWIGLGDRGYAYLCLTLVVQTLNLAVEGGEAQLVPWLADIVPDRRTNVVLNTAAVLASVRFLMFFLDLRKSQAGVARLLDVCSVLLGGLIAVSLWHTWRANASFGNLVLLVVIGAILYANAVAVVRRQREAWFLMLAWAPLMGVLVVLVGANQRWWPSYAWLDYAYPVGLAFGSLGLLLGLTAKLQQLRRDHDSAKHRATYDRLTSVMTRAAIEEALRLAVSDAHRSGRPLSVVFFDIDHFKRINDEHGHSAGDEALRTVAERARNRLRSTDLCGRYGGDEILVGLPGTKLEHGLLVAEHLRRAVSANPPTIGGQSLSLSLSLGVAELRHGESLEQLLERADAALYASKAGGRDRVTAHDAGPREHAAA